MKSQERDRDGDLEYVDQDVDSEDVDHTAVAVDLSLPSREEVVEEAKKNKRKQ